LVEFTREPDALLGLLSLGMSMGQWLSLPMVIVGILLLRHSRTA
jgi:phosphatidylglycerol:prolipoprotein diacylglycerol transferase